MQMFDTIDYLSTGNERQKSAYATLTKYGLMKALSGYDPILTGTIPINIAIDSSDLDIICCYKDAEDFVLMLKKCFEHLEGFACHYNKAGEQVTANFMLDGWEIEIFGQPIPTQLQYAYRHMIVEYNLLKLYGEKFRQRIIDLKKDGHKTEPAFAIALGLQGDPYQALLALNI
ncbi:DUF4269 domain-containing protein [Mucilaginibacter sp. UR6-1]|uniref:DUF4269 domain-containing protein n=1 Tax=Mucilaginibacter sp. UR6-1 TaxID=1435643 RepID=UPI001E641087|nr:DUF4269 domain-containing protein [Mucilaginibacter sp. UR6-1]MCC8408027.1 DUF4269 domain-containing protein [Mucilaginibacter sp. UR6-1]